MNFLIPDKLTDEQIINALEEHIGMRTLANKSPKINIDLLIAILDLINRQKIQNKELWEERNRIYNSLEETKAEVKEYRTAYVSAQAEIERLRKGWEADIVLTADAKAEAIKEFADRLRKKLIGYGEINTTFVRSILDNLVKEMVGD